VKNQVGALATSIIYEPKAISIAEFGIKRAKKKRSEDRLFKINIEETKPALK
jgi:hypothetical protein